MKYRLFYLCSLWMLFFTGSLCAQIVNGGFEIAEPVEGFDFLSPVDWVCEHYRAVDCNFLPDPNPISGESVNWELDDIKGLEAFEGEFFVMLSTSDIMPEATYAKISQRVEFFEGQKISGAYFFGTYDYYPFNDYASIELVAEQIGTRNIILVDISLEDVGTYSSMKDWETFTHVFTAAEAGVYDLEITVSDFSDTALATYFAVDGLEVCWLPEYGDVNMDCKVNFEDFSFLAQDWLLYDPNYVSTDPNDWRQYETDFDGSQQVDVEDVRLMSEYWLYTQ